jgi:hypothetical protein
MVDDKKRLPSWARRPAVAGEALRGAHRGERGDERVLAGLSKLRADAAYDEASRCDDCTAARALAGDQDALCDDHLGHAMGLHSNWDAFREE